MKVILALMSVVATQALHKADLIPDQSLICMIIVVAIYICYLVVKDFANREKDIEQLEHKG